MLAGLDPSRLPLSPTTRFAPSPTGVLHLGHVANAIWTWGVAQATGGRVVLRMEDHDRGRCRPAFEEAIRRDLRWLGLHAEPASEGSFDGPSPFRQSDNDARYRAALDRLVARATVYGCRCSRKDVARVLGDGATPGEERRYPGTCRALGIPPGPGVGIRVALPDRSVEFTDLRLGPVRQTPSRQCGDLLLRDQVGNWTYQFAVVVDDLAHGVDLVIRGEDILPSTGRQLLLAELLQAGGERRYLHHPLITDERGVKLSKRDGAAGIEDLRASGQRAEDVLGLAAWRTGLLDRPSPLSPASLGDLFRDR